MLLWSPLAETTIRPEAAPSGTRAIRKSSELTTTAPSVSPNCTRGWRISAGRRPEPRIRTSAPGNAAAGTTASMCGLPLTFFLPSKRSEIPIGSESAQRREMNPELHQRQRVQAGANIIEHDPPAAGQFFQQPQRRRFENIEPSKKYKTGKSILPSQRNRNKGDPLANNFVNNDEVGVGLAALAFYRRRGGDAHQEPAQTQKQKPGPA